MIVESTPVGLSQLHEALATGHLRIHFSQFGEDAVIWTYLQGRPPGFYVDIGCHDPFRYSNTALLAIARGWRGINVDVDPRAIAKFARARPNDINLCTAVGKAPGLAEVTLFDDGAVNSLDEVAAKDPRWAHLNPRKAMAPVTTLASIFDQHLPAGQNVDFLNVDVEGWSLEVLQSSDWQRFRPHYIAIEVDHFVLGAPQGHEVFVFLQTVGYRLAGHVFNTSIYERQP